MPWCLEPWAYLRIEKDVHLGKMHKSEDSHELTVRQFTV